MLYAGRRQRRPGGGAQARCATRSPRARACASSRRSSSCRAATRASATTRRGCPRARETVELPRRRRTAASRRIACRAVGHAAMLLGAGRETVDSRIDPAVGLVLHKKVGDLVMRGRAAADRARQRPRAAWTRRWPAPRSGAGGARGRRARAARSGAWCPRSWPEPRARRPRAGGRPLARSRRRLPSPLAVRLVGSWAWPAMLLIAWLLELRPQGASACKTGGRRPRPAGRSSACSCSRRASGQLVLREGRATRRTACWTSWWRAPGSSSAPAWTSARPAPAACPRRRACSVFAFQRAAHHHLRRRADSRSSTTWA